MDSLPAPEFRQIGDSYEYNFPSVGVQVSFRRFHESSRDGVHAEIVVAHRRPGRAQQPILLHNARIGLLSTQTQAALCRILREQVEDVDWPALVAAVCYLARERYEQGEPTIDLRDVDPDARPRWLLWPYLEYGGPTILFGPGGSAKSLVGLALAAGIASGSPLIGELHGKAGPVIYLDYETDQYLHAERLRALLRGSASTGDGPAAWPPVYYRRMVAPLAQDTDRIHRDIDHLGIVAAVVDSAGIACGGEPEAAAAALTTMAAARALEVPVLFVGHVSHAVKGAMRNGGRGGVAPFGTIYWENAARNTWSARREGEESGDLQYVILRHEKTNNGRYEHRHAVELVFRSEGSIDDPAAARTTSLSSTVASGNPHSGAAQHATAEGTQASMVTITMHRRELREIASLYEHLPLAERILVTLGRGSIPVEELAEELGTPLPTVRVRLSELSRSGKVIRLPGHVWGLPYDGPEGRPQRAFTPRLQPLGR